MVRSSSLPETLKRSWEATGVKVRPGLDAAALDAFESRHGVRLPPAFRAFYTLMDGMEEYESDEEWVYFWSLGKVEALPETLVEFREILREGRGSTSLADPAAYFAFADYSLNALYLAVRLTPDPDAPSPVVFIAGATMWDEIAPTFEEFLARYAADPGKALFS